MIVGLIKNYRLSTDCIRYWLRQCAYQGLILPLGGAAAVAVYALVTTQQIALPLGLVVFLLIYSSYRIDHLAEVGRFDGPFCSARSLALRRRNIHIILALVAFGTAIAVTWLFSGLFCALLLLIFPLAVTLYGTPLLGKITRGRLGIERIKNVPYLKSLYTSFFWAMLFVFASFFLDTPQDSVLAFFFFWMWMRLFINTIFCDCKDLERDRIEGVATLVLDLGMRRTMRLLSIINSASLIWLAAFVVAGVLPLWLIPLGLVGVYTRYQLHQVARNETDIEYLCDVVMDGEFIWWLPCGTFGLVAMSFINS